MTVKTSTRKQTFAGGQDSMTFSFKTLASFPAYIKATKTLLSSAEDTALVKDSDYTVAVESDGEGGVVTMTPSVSTLYSVTVYRETSDIQESDYDDYNNFPADTVENDLDRRTLIAQESAENTDRTIKVPVTSAASGLTIESPQEGLLLSWRGSTIVNTTVSSQGGLVLSTDTSLGTSDTIAVSQKAIKTYADATFLAQSLLSTDSTLGTSATLVVAQKAIKTYVDSNAILTSAITTDSTLAVTSNTAVASSQAVKGYVDTQIGISSHVTGVYDSGWFACVERGTYAKTHGLLTLNIITKLYWSSSNVGADMEDAQSNDNNPIGGHIQKITTQSLTVQAGYNGTSYSYESNGTTETRDDGYYRVVAISLA